jgi:hypothetical protein
MSGRAKRDDELDWIVGSKERVVRDATHFRSTWVTASQATIRDRGYFPRYEANLTGPHRDEVLAIIAAQWLPMEVARTHYLACEKLDLSTSEQLDIGMAATKRANATSMSFAVRMAQNVGVTPWTIFAQTPRIYERIFLGGGGMRVAKLGPKEARLDVMGYPLAVIRYNRVTMRGIVAAFVELFCEKAYVKEIPEATDQHTIAMRISWV